MYSAIHAVILMIGYNIRVSYLRDFYFTKLLKRKCKEEIIEKEVIY